MRGRGEPREVRSQLAPLLLFIREGKFLRIRLEKKIERVEHRHLGDEIDLDAQLTRLVGERQAGEIVRLRVLLPIDEVLRRLDLEGVRENPGTAMRRRPQPYDLGTQRDAAVVAIVGDVIERNVNRHLAVSPARAVFKVCCDSCMRVTCKVGTAAKSESGMRICARCALSWRNSAPRWLKRRAGAAYAGLPGRTMTFNRCSRMAFSSVQRPVCTGET